MIFSTESKLIVFFAGVAILAKIGSAIVPLLGYVTYGAILIILVLCGFILYKKLFR